MPADSAGDIIGRPGKRKKKGPLGFLVGSRVVCPVVCPGLRFFQTYPPSGYNAFLLRSFQENSCLLNYRYTFCLLVSSPKFAVLELIASGYNLGYQHVVLTW